MNKVVLICLLVASATAHADWEKVSVDNRKTTYFDPTFVQIDGDARKFWTMVDLRKAGSAGELSIKYQMNVACSGRILQYLYAVVYSGHMGKGAVLATMNPNIDPEPISPGSMGADLLKAMCNQ